MYLTTDSLKRMAASCVAALKTENISLNDSITKTALEHEMSADQVKRMVETTNQLAYLSELSTSDDRTFEFDVARYEEIIAGIMPTMNKEASAVSGNPLELVAQSFQTPLEKVASSAPLEYTIKDLQKVAGQQRIILNELKDAEYGNLMKIAQYREEILRDPEALLKMAHFYDGDYLSQIVFGHNKVASEVRQEWSDDEMNVLQALSETIEMCKEAQEKKRELTDKVENAEGIIKEAFLSAAANAAKSMGSSIVSKGKKAMSIGEAALSTHEVSTGTKRTHNAWSALRGQKMNTTLLGLTNRTLQGFDKIAEAYEIPLSRQPAAKEALREELTKTASYGSEFASAFAGDKVGKAALGLGAGALIGLGSLAVQKIGRAFGKIKGRTGFDISFRKALEESEILQNDPMKAKRMAMTVYGFAPTVASDPNVLTNILVNSIHGSSIDLQTVKAITELEEKLVKTRKALAGLNGQDINMTDRFSFNIPDYKKSFADAQLLKKKPSFKKGMIAGASIATVMAAAHLLRKKDNNMTDLYKQAGERRRDRIQEVAIGAGQGMAIGQTAGFGMGLAAIDKRNRGISRVLRGSNKYHRFAPALSLMGTGARSGIGLGALHGASKNRGLEKDAGEISDSALTGAGRGAAIGAGYSALIHGIHDGSTYGWKSGLANAAFHGIRGGLRGGAVGAGVGALIGSSRHKSALHKQDLQDSHDLAAFRGMHKEAGLVSMARNAGRRARLVGASLGRRVENLKKGKQDLVSNVSDAVRDTKSVVKDSVKAFKGSGIKVGKSRTNDKTSLADHVRARSAGISAKADITEIKRQAAKNSFGDSMRKATRGMSNKQKKAYGKKRTRSTHVNHAKKHAEKAGIKATNKRADTLATGEFSKEHAIKGTKIDLRNKKIAKGAGIATVGTGLVGLGALGGSAHQAGIQHG